MTDTPRIGHNGYTRQEWLYTILNSGEVTRIGQHLALVIYHLADTQTHIAALSLRDLERITGWTRQAIRDHLDEIDLFIKVKWGSGRAKSNFELQGIIATEIERFVAARSATSTVAKTQVPEIAATSHASMVAATVTGNDSVQPDRHNADATRDFVANDVTEKSKEGGIIGGEINGYLQSKNLSLGYARDDANATPPTFTIEEDGSFAGQVYELSAIDIVGLQVAYLYLQFPADLISADVFFASEFAKLSERPNPAERLSRLHQYLSKRNRETGVQYKAITDAQKAKDVRRGDDECYWQGDRIVLSGEFRQELLQHVGGDDGRLERTVAKSIGKVPIELKGPNLRKTVRAEFIKHLDWDARDERKTTAIESRGGKKPSQSGALLSEFDRKNMGEEEFKRAQAELREAGHA